MKCLNDSIPVRITTMLARKPTMIHIARNGVWSTDLENGSTMFSYEKPTTTSDVANSWRASGTPVFHSPTTALSSYNRVGHTVIRETLPNDRHRGPQPD